MRAGVLVLASVTAKALGAQMATAQALEQSRSMLDMINGMNGAGETPLANGGAAEENEIEAFARSAGINLADVRGATSKSDSISSGLDSVLMRGTPAQGASPSLTSSFLSHDLSHTPTFSAPKTLPSVSSLSPNPLSMLSSTPQVEASSALDDSSALGSFSGRYAPKQQLSLLRSSSSTVATLKDNPSQWLLNSAKDSENAAVRSAAEIFAKATQRSLLQREQYETDVKKLDSNAKDHHSEKLTAMKTILSEIQATAHEAVGSEINEAMRQTADMSDRADKADQAASEMRQAARERVDGIQLINRELMNEVKRLRSNP